MKSSLGRKLINAPYLLWAALFILIPLIIVAYYAFTDTEGNFSFEYIVKIGEYKEVLIRSLVYAAVATAITLVMAYPVAYYMSRSKVSTQKMMMWSFVCIKSSLWKLVIHTENHSQFFQRSQRTIDCINGNIRHTFLN